MNLAYRLSFSEPLLDGIRRIAREQCDRAVEEIHSDEIDRQRTVHQVRKRCKKLRGLLRLVRPSLGSTYRQENVTFRDAARRLSPLRDAGVVVETFDELLDAFGAAIDRERLEPVRAQLEVRRDRIEDCELGPDARIAEFERAIREARDRIDDWHLEDDGWKAIEGGLRKTYRRGRRRMSEAYQAPTTENFHEWRKRVKYHWYHQRLLNNVWPDEIGVRQHAAKELSDLLGDEHDLATLRATVHVGAGEFGDERIMQAVIALIDRRRAELRQAARPLGMRLYAERPGNHARRIGAYWQAAQRHACKQDALPNVND